MIALTAPLDVARILRTMPIAARRALATMEVMAEVDSTNAELLRRRDRGGDCVLLAESQTAGRGRQGRRWHSPPGGNLYLSLRHGFRRPLTALAGLPLAVAVAVAEALAGLGIEDVALKWPNDLLRNERKLGGILIESTAAASGPATMVIGIGLNIAMPDSGAEIDRPWTDLRDALPAPIDRNPIAAAVIAGLIEALPLFDRDGLTPFLPAWHTRDVLRGRVVEASDGDRQLAGVSEGVADDGALILRTERGVFRLYAGETHLRREPKIAAPA
ncbi:MAG TPA: biotin--[acetyl-CoA-carboxylase] ligase [Xanthomonadales bacterium]|nr:biotin--[acetyl-CoA-carboxylase] ligase [Xanthomonadales bacterium]